MYTFKLLFAVFNISQQRKRACGAQSFQCRQFRRTCCFHIHRFFSFGIWLFSLSFFCPIENQDIWWNCFPILFHQWNGGESECRSSRIYCDVLNVQRFRSLKPFFPLFKSNSLSRFICVAFSFRSYFLWFAIYFEFGDSFSISDWAKRSGKRRKKSGRFVLEKRCCLFISLCHWVCWGCTYFSCVFTFLSIIGVKIISKKYVLLGGVGRFYHIRTCNTAMVVPC